MSTPTAKRSLFQTPTRAAKRRKASAKKPSMRIPRSLLPETKQYLQSSLTNATTNAAYSFIPIDMTQGVQSTQFLGSKFRISRIRVFYDVDSSITLTKGVRISVLMNKDPSSTPSLSSELIPWDTTSNTVVHDMFLPNDPGLRTGTFDVVGPFNVEMSTTGSNCQRNNLTVWIQSAGVGAALRTQVSYAVWYTDA